MKKKLLTIIVFYVISMGMLFAQVNITGKVTNISGEPIPGVNVIVKGTSTGTVTDVNGNYSLGNINADAVLQFSFLGMLTEEVTVGSQTEINVTLVDDLQSLEEVVVIGYGSVKRANLTGAVADIRADELEDLPTASLSEALVGKLPGIKINQSTGLPGSSKSITIRTSSSYGVATEDPIYVIDGVIYDKSNDGESQFSLLDASEVESISFLKDAAAAVYGARATGGVILVTTKRGKEGKAKINYSGSYGVSNPTQIPEMLSSSDLANMYNEILDLWGGGTIFDPYAEDEIAYFDSIGAYNWLDGLISPAHQTKHTLNVSGGTDRVKYYAGGSYYNETGIIDLTDYEKYGIRTNIEADITSNLKATLGLNYYYSYRIQPNYDGESSDGVLRDTYKFALTATPWIPPLIDGLPVANQTVFNPHGLFQSGSYKKGWGNNTNINAGLEYKIPFIDGLKVSINFNRYENNSRGKQFRQDFKLYEFPRFGSHWHIVNDTLPPNNERQVDNKEGLQESYQYNQSYQLNASISYTKKFGLHDINALLIYEQGEAHGNNFWTRRNTTAAIKGYDYLWAYNLTGYEDGSGANESGRLGFIGRFNYGYAQKYLLETTFRYEASQKFHPDERWGLFPAVSAGWVVSEEDFLNNMAFISFLKLRVSAGLVGNDNIGIEQWRSKYEADALGAIFGSASNEVITNALEARFGGIEYPSVTWQKSRSYNIGLDSRFINNTIKFGMDYYYRYTFDILDRRTNLPVTTGLTTGTRPPYENYGKMYAKGIELQLEYNNKIGSHFSYNIGGNFSWDKHMRLKVFQNPAVIGNWDDYLLNDPSNQPGWICLGIIRDEEHLNQIMQENPNYKGVRSVTSSGDTLIFAPEPGMLYYQDLRGESYVDSVTGLRMYEAPDGYIDGDDRTIIAKYTSPPYHYGFSLGASWKGISIDMTFSGEFGHNVFIEKDEQKTPNPLVGVSNVFAFWGDYWSDENTDASMPRPYRWGFADEQISTFWKLDGHTLILNNLKISYQIPLSLIQKYNISQLKISFSTKNLWTIINPYDYKDPRLGRAYDYPFMRTLNFGINVTL